MRLVHTDSIGNIPMPFVLKQIQRNELANSGLKTTQTVHSTRNCIVRTDHCANISKKREKQKQSKGEWKLNAEKQVMTEKFKV